MGTVMLALSTFRQSEKAVDLALETAAKGGELVVVQVTDVNLARYFVGTDVGLDPELKKSCEKDLLQQHEEHNRRKAEEIMRKAAARGIRARSIERTGRFALVCLEVAQQEHPDVIITTRSKRPDWVRKFFGSPVDHLIASAGCKVIEA